MRVARSSLVVSALVLITVGCRSSGEPAYPDQPYLAVVDPGGGFEIALAHDDPSMDLSVVVGGLEALSRLELTVVHDDGIEIIGWQEREWPIRQGPDQRSFELVPDAPINVSGPAEILMLTIRSVRTGRHVIDVDGHATDSDGDRVAIEALPALFLSY